MASGELVFQIGQDTEADWARCCESARTTHQPLRVTTSQSVINAADMACERVTFVTTPPLASLDVAIDQVPKIWAATFPRLKTAGVLVIPADRLIEKQPHSMSTALLGYADEISIVTQDASANDDLGDVFAPLADGGNDYDAALSRSLREASVSEAILAGLLLMNEADEASHQVSQCYEGTHDFDYWHGLMHRREPDFGNASYWFRRVGSHPVYATLPKAIAEQCAAVGQEELADDVPSVWDPFWMIDLCRQAVDGDTTAETLARVAQHTEWRALLSHVA